jgi:16S rRNA (cytosine1402-N4)-methyltransferase
VLSRFRHEPVLLDAVLSHLHPTPGAVVLDGTLGGGGHAAGILERTAPDGLLIGLDLDGEALLAARERLAPFAERVRLVRASFRELDRVLEAEGIEAVDGVLLDLGVSSHQLDTPERGFRFGEAEAAVTPLDMRMDPTRGASAAQLLQRATSEELETWFREYGELRGARRLARTIVSQRELEPLETAADLLRAVREARVGGGRRHNPATLVFQALRIAVNDELGALQEGLDAAVEVLRPGGHLVVIAYHSLEDRIVKHHLRREEKGCVCPPRVPVCVCGRRPRLHVVTRKPVRPDEDEVARNPRARSARLRAARRLEGAPTPDGLTEEAA